MFITETLTRFPTLTASRLFVMVRARGYRGSASQFRHRVALLRPRRVAEAYLRLRTLPGEQAQVDWAHFGHLVIGRARRPLMAFVMVLSYSRAIYLRFFLDARMASFLAGHAGAFAAFGGVVTLTDPSRVRVVQPVDVPNPHWIHPIPPNKDQQEFGDALIDAHPYILLHSAVSGHSWNLLVNLTTALPLMTNIRSERFALDPRLRVKH